MRDKLLAAMLVLAFMRPGISLEGVEGVETQEGWVQLQPSDEQVNNAPIIWPSQSEEGYQQEEPTVEQVNNTPVTWPPPQPLPRQPYLMPTKGQLNNTPVIFPPGLRRH